MSQNRIARAGIDDLGLKDLHSEIQFIKCKPTGGAESLNGVCDMCNGAPPSSRAVGLATLALAGSPCLCILHVIHFVFKSIWTACQPLRWLGRVPLPSPGPRMPADDGAPGMAAPFCGCTWLPGHAVCAAKYCQHLKCKSAPKNQ